MWKHDASAEEVAAARLLREKGWNVQEPQCPLCHGLGGVSRMENNKDAYVLTYEPCPNGCPPAQMYYPATTTTHGTGNLRNLRLSVPRLVSGSGGRN